jgi:hypothetical protein
MITKTLTKQSLEIIEAYLNFPSNDGSFPIPYQNNKKAKVRASIEVLSGKGSPRDIYEEAILFALKEKIDLKKLSSADTKRYLIEHNLGIDCSGFCYHVLNTESISRNLGSIRKKISFSHLGNPIRRMIAKFRTSRNTNVTAFAQNNNSKIVDLLFIKPGDFLVILFEDNLSIKNHIILFHQIEYQNNIPTRIHYSHSIAWPKDGEHGHGVSQGIIEIKNPNKNILEQKWIEKESSEEENYTYRRVKEAQKVEMRRLNWF